MTYYKHGSITYDLLKEWQHNISCPTLYMAAQHMTYYKQGSTTFRVLLTLYMVVQHMTYYKHGSTTFQIYFVHGSTKYDLFGGTYEYS